MPDLFVSAARSRLEDVVDDACASHEPVFLTCRGRRVAAVIDARSWRVSPGLMPSKAHLTVVMASLAVSGDHRTVHRQDRARATRPAGGHHQPQRPPPHRRTTSDRHRQRHPHRPEYPHPRHTNRHESGLSAMRRWYAHGASPAPTTARCVGRTPPRG